MTINQGPNQAVIRPTNATLPEVADPAPLFGGRSHHVSFGEVLRQESQRNSAQQDLASGILSKIKSYGQNWLEVEQRMQNLQGRLAPDFRAMFELQRCSQRIQLQTHIVTAGCESVSQTIKRLQHTG